MGASEPRPAEQHRSIEVPGLDQPVRIDVYLAGLDELDLSRNAVQKLIAEGRVTIGGAAVNKKLQLKGGERIALTIPPPPVTELDPEAIPLVIVFEDDHLMVINKPPGLVTHPAPGNRTGTLVNAVIHHLGGVPGGGPAERPGIVHRLDKNTSGLIIVAKSTAAFRRLQQTIQERAISRTYLAVVCGHMKERQGRIDLPIGRSRRDRKKMAVGGDAEREAVTDYEVIERFRTYDYLRVRLHTGRTHQIRVHLSHLGHPVLGDPDYGGRTKWLRGAFGPERQFGRELLEDLDRQALHAHRLELEHPTSDETLDLRADPPDDFQLVLDRLASENR